jgi:PAS domain S-box-containing protein
MTGDPAPVAWSGGRVVVTFPEHFGGPEADRAADQLLRALDEGAATVIADMSATKTCDSAAVTVLSRAYQRAAASRAELRMVMAAPDVQRVVSAELLDRLVPVYTSLAAALAAGGPARDPGGQAPLAASRPDSGALLGTAGPVNEAVLRQLIDLLDDGVALVGEDGAILLANRRLTAMLGYQPAELAGRPVESLVPDGLREAHRRHRGAYARNPAARPMADRARLVALCGDGSTLPVTITLTPVPTADGHLVLAVVRDAARAQQADDLITLLSAAATREAERNRELLDRVVASLFHAGLSLQAATAEPGAVARERITDALQRLDDTIHEIRTHVFRPRRPDDSG